MHNLLLTLTSVVLVALPGAASDGVVRVKSAHDVKTTVDRLESALVAKGMTVFARIDHAAGAKKSDQELRPTEVLVFGNPKVGTPLMQCQQTAAIDLPQKALVFEDEAGAVWLTYNDPKYVAKRHAVRGCDEALKKIEDALVAFSRVATSKDVTSSRGVAAADSANPIAPKPKTKTKTKPKRRR